MDAISIGLVAGQLATLALFILSEAIGLSGLEYNSLLQVMVPAFQKIAGLFMNRRRPGDGEEVLVPRT